MGPFDALPTGNLENGIDNLGWVLGAETADKYGSWSFEADADQDYFVRGFKLGPYGSRWAVALVAETGPDCGELVFQLATGSEDAPNEGFAVPDGMLDSPYNVSNTYTQFDDFATQDLYNAAPGVVNPYQLVDFRVKGGDGAAHTAITDPDPDMGAGVVASDGGAGVWWLRVLIDGKNGSSSGFRATIRSLYVVRLTWDGFIA
jgi:hypothetical protein